MKRYIILALAAVLSSACSLEEHPTTSFTEDAVYETEESLEALMYGAYRHTFSSTASTTIFYNFGCSSRFIQWKRADRSGRQYEQYLRGTLYGDQSEGNSILRTQFTAIQTCNTIIEKLQSSPVDAAYKLEIEAEARMLRAINYFYAVRMFGDVPLFTKPIKSDSDSYVKRTSFKEVYAQIIEDLDFAWKNMRDKERQSGINGNNGRADKYAALSFLSEVYLQIGSLLASPDDQAFGTLASGYVKPEFSSCGITSAAQAFRLALQAADEVIENGPYELEDDFRTLFKWEPFQAENAYSSKERIFVMQNSMNGGTDARFTMNTLPNFMLGTRQGEELHTCSTAGYIRPFRMVLDKWSRTYGGTQQKSGSDMLYTDCKDPRYAATYISRYQATASSSGAKYDPPREVTVYPVINGDDAYFRKYFCSEYDADAAYADFYIIRLAEIYLVAAEACAQLGLDATGKLGDAYDYVEAVHARARNSKDGEPSEQPRWTKGQFHSKEELVSAIFWEIIFETHGEGQEWFNSHRHGAEWLVDNVYEPMHQFLLASEQADYKTQWWYNLGYELPRTVYNAQCGLLCEYPEYELQYNQALNSEDQNVYNSRNSAFAVNASADDTNESYNDEEIIFPW